jgi:monoamine oxidase
MKFITEPERKTPVLSEVDLLVCGGGVAGVAAAYSAAQNGAKVLLLEKYPFLGGLATGALVITTPPLTNGINLEICRRLTEQSVYKKCRHSGEVTEAEELHAMDPEILKYELIRMLREQKVELLLHTYVVDAIMDGNRINGVIIETKSGREAVLAKMVIDTTGDADIAVFSGAPFTSVKKPMTMMYNIIGADVKKILNKIGNWSNLKTYVQAAKERDGFEFDLGIYPEYGAPGVHAEELVHEGELNIWSGMLNGMDGANPRDLTRAELITREHVMRLTAFFKDNIPGFEDARIEYTATQVGVRASRQIVGKATPTNEAVRETVFEDTVVKPYARRTIRLPYGSLLPRKIENLLVAGRCISADEAAMGQLRLIPVCTATGQAAGTAAALSMQQGILPEDIDIGFLQEKLAEQGMDLGLED